MRRTFVTLLLLTLAAWWPGRAARAFTLTLLDQAGLCAELTASAERLSLEEPLVATLEVTAPVQLQFTLPDLRRRLRGFAVVEDFPAGRVEVGNKARTRWRLRLTPKGEGPWRLMPFVLTAQDSRLGTTASHLTQAVDFPEPLPLPGASGSPECDLAPEWVAPGWRTFGLWSLYGALAVALVLGLWALGKRLRRTLRERKLSPAQRAQVELERLLLQNLPERGLFKRFYAELTGVVRRYYERAYALRATRQTTAEFLANLAADARFSSDDRAALADFLTAADRIKFANITATCAEAEAATAAAKRALTVRPAETEGVAP